MDELEIRIQGKLSFTQQVMEGLVRFTSDDVTIQTAAGILILVGFLWSWFKQFSDPEHAQNPARVFVVSIIFYLMFVSPISPKYRVLLTSDVNPSDFAVVDEVPFIAAFPAWLTSNFMTNITDEMKQAFLPVSYTSSEIEPDPLGALVTLYNTPPPDHFVFSNSTNQDGVDLNRSFENYMRDCYETDHQLTGAPPTSPHNLLRTSRMGIDVLQGVRVSYNGITTTIYLGGDPSGETLSCDAAYNKLFAYFGSVQLEDDLTSFYESKGATVNALETAGSIIYGSYGVGPSAYDIMLGHFLATLVRQGMSNTAFETQVDQMVFQAMKKRTFEKAGESDLFQILRIPMISALEAFIFFIAPVMMLLFLFAEKGMSMIGKYLFLALFCYLFAYVKVFTDLYTAGTIEEAFSQLPLGSDPLSFDNFPATMKEIEAYLTTASALNTGIPMLVMFILYASVHPMMGVMNKISGGGVDGAMGAPAISSAMTGGTLNMGDKGMTHVLSTGGMASTNNLATDASIGGGNLGNSINTATSSALSTANKEISSQQQSFTSQFASGLSNAKVDTNSASNMTTDTWSSMNSQQRVASLSQALENSRKFEGMDTNALALQVAGKSGASLGFVGLEGKLASNNSITSSEKFDEAQKVAEQWVRSWHGTDSSGNTQAFSQSSMNSNTFTSTDSQNELSAKAASISEAQERQRVLNETAQYGQAVSSNQALDFTALKSSPNFNATDLYTSLNSTSSGKEALSSIGVKSESDFWRIAVDKRGDNPGSSAGVLKGFLDSGANSESKGIAAQMAANSLGNSEYAAGFVNLSKYYQGMASFEKDFANDSTGEKASMSLSMIESGKPHNSSVGELGGKQIKAGGENITMNSAAVAGAQNVDADDWKGKKEDMLKSLDMLPGSAALSEATGAYKNLFAPSAVWDDQGAGAIMATTALSTAQSGLSLEKGLGIAVGEDVRNISDSDAMLAYNASRYAVETGSYNQFSDSVLGKFSTNQALLESRVNANPEIKQMADRAYSGEINESSAVMALNGGQTPSGYQQSDYANFAYKYDIQGDKDFRRDSIAQSAYEKGNNFASYSSGSLERTGDKLNINKSDDNSLFSGRSMSDWAHNASDFAYHLSGMTHAEAKNFASEGMSSVDQVLGRADAQHMQAAGVLMSPVFSGMNELTGRYDAFMGSADSNGLIPKDYVLGDSSQLSNGSYADNVTLNGVEYTKVDVPGAIDGFNRYADPMGNQWVQFNGNSTLVEASNTYGAVNVSSQLGNIRDGDGDYRVLHDEGGRTFEIGTNTYTFQGANMMDGQPVGAIYTDEDGNRYNYSGGSKMKPIYD